MQSVSCPIPTTITITPRSPSWNTNNFSSYSNKYYNRIQMILKHKWDPNRYDHSGVRVNREVIAMKGGSTSELEPHYRIQFRVILKTPLFSVCLCMCACALVRERCLSLTHGIHIAYSLLHWLGSLIRRKSWDVCIEFNTKFSKWFLLPPHHHCP